MKPKIIFEDKTILVIDKPAGMVVNRAKTAKGETIQDWIEEYLKVEGRGIGERAGIVHRLDKETSGILVVAKTQKAFENLQKQFKERRVEKKYLALVHGRVEPKEGVIEAPITRSPFDRKKFGVFLGGRPAKTHYRVVEYLGGIRSLANHRHRNEGMLLKGTLCPDAGLQDSSRSRTHAHYSLLELTPETGRTHQIRVHLKYIGHPVVGDAKYAGRKTARSDRKWCPRQFLHASYLSFIHSETGKKVEFSSKLPPDLKRVLPR